MTFDDDAFARSLGDLRPVKAEMDPAVTFYQAGFAAGAAESKAGMGLLLRTAAVALIAASLSAGGAYYFGHQRGERNAYLAATTAPADTVPGREFVAPESPDKQIGAIDAETTEPAESPIASPPEEPDRPQPKAPPQRPKRLAAIESPAWQWIIRQLDIQTTIPTKGFANANSPLRIRPTDGQWEELVNFHYRPQVRPRSIVEENLSGDGHAPALDRPLTITPSEEWLRAITTY